MTLDPHEIQLIMKLDSLMNEDLDVKLGKNSSELAKRMAFLLINLSIIDENNIDTYIKFEYKNIIIRKIYSKTDNFFHKEQVYKSIRENENFEKTFKKFERNWKLKKILK